MTAGRALLLGLCTVAVLAGCGRKGEPSRPVPEPDTAAGEEVTFLDDVTAEPLDEDEALKRDPDTPTPSDPDSP